jgi:hypothetical protein
MLAFGLMLCGADPAQRFVYPRGGQLVYDASERGDRIPDFSHCGFGGGGVELPQVGSLVEVAPVEGDDTAQLQAAIDRLAGEIERQGVVHGAVLLGPGEYEVSGTLVLNRSGVVLRGCGAGTGGTVLAATGKRRRAVIQVGAPSAYLAAGPVHGGDAPGMAVTTYSPVGTRTLNVGDTSAFQVGDRVRIDHVGSQAWVQAVAMDRAPSRDLKGSWLDWKPGTINLCSRRTIVEIAAGAVTLDAPLTSALDPALATVTLSKDERYSGGGSPCSRIGVESLRIVSEFEAANAQDEEHAWDGVSLNDVEDAWVRDVVCEHLAGSAVAVWELARRVSVVDCRSLNPVSENGGWRRHTFLSSGQQTLFLRCQADQGRHDFAVGHLASGPNAFVDCTATYASQFSGPIGSWGNGVLYDNVEIDGAGLSLTNRETAAQGTGWSAANCVLWNCIAPLVTCRQPPTAQNWAIGIWGEVVGDGHWRQLNEFATPRSLYEAQLIDRLGVGAARGVFASRGGARDQHALAGSRPSRPATPGPATHAVGEPARGTETPRHGPLQVANGWLTFGDRLAAGEQVVPTWWRGSVVPTKVADFGPSLTRFVPGRYGSGYTDDLEGLTAQMLSSNQVALVHHWGLWYDRRRDDHQMLRRADGEVWPPFYEQPWARSGQGRAWDGLSRYDLTKFNPWYFSRLKEFANLADANGLILIQQMYFQHNVLEAGAHYADFPWRPANCLQDTGFPEPPQYENRKRIFLAEEFYDVTHPVRRELHAAYIRHCLDVLGDNTNVLFLIGEEFTGPEHFLRFWLQTIGEWQREHRRNLLIALSSTKDVQDAILSDAALAPLVDVIDLKYWWHTPSGTPFAPAAGQNRSPRQQLREWQGDKRLTDAEVARAVHEYRRRYPGKAVICSLPGADPWTVVSAGGSLPALPASVSQELLRVIPTTVLASPSGTPVVYSLIAPNGAPFVPRAHSQ